MSAPAHTVTAVPALLLAAMLCLHAAPARALGTDWAFSVHFENDLFADTDQQYTSGIKLTAVSPDLTSEFRERENLPAWLRDVLPLRLVPFDKRDGVARTFAFSLGQNIYTPQDTARRTLVRDDRPYAGWLYLAATFQTRTENRQDTFDAQVGVIGPYAFAEEAQEIVHRARGLSVPRGWDNQLRSEPGLVLAYERVLRTHLTERNRRLGADLLTRGGLTLGNVAVYGSAGLQVRAGWNLPLDFGYSVIRPGGVTQIATLPQRAGSDGEPDPYGALRNRGFTAYLFAGAEGRMVGHDIFLDGNTFRDSHGVDHKPFVADLVAGITVGHGGLKLSLANVLRTREFRGQVRDHRFGSISLSYAF